MKKVDGCKNNLGKSFTAKVGEDIPCRYSMSLMYTFDGTENKHDFYRGENCMETFCESLRENATKINNFN